MMTWSSFISLFENEIFEIEIQEWQRPAAGEIFDNVCHSRKHTINEITSESEIQELRMPVAGEIFYDNCYSRRQIMNGIVNEIKL